MTGRPEYRHDIIEQRIGQWIDHCPSTAGGKNWHAMSYHAPSRQLIIPLSQSCGSMMALASGAKGKLWSARSAPSRNTAVI